MRKPLVLLFSAFLALCFLNACAKDRYHRVESRNSFFETDVDHRAYVKKAFVVLNHGAATPFGPAIDTLFLQSLVETIDDEVDHFVAVSPHSAGSADALKSQDLFSTPAQIFDMAQAARMQGYHYLMDAGVWQIEPALKKTGTWIFRKERGYLHLVTALDVYDVLTAAKLLSLVEESTVKISRDAYESLVAGLQDGLEIVEEELVEHAVRLGEQAAEAIDGTPWMAVVSAVEGEQVTLAADGASGLKVGHRLAVYEGRRIVTGPDGARFIAPGYQLGRIRITGIESDQARAAMETPADIKPGDIAAAAE